MSKNLSANMLADYAGKNLKLYTEKIAGNVTACMGFIKEEKSGLYVPNTILRRDMRDISESQKRILAAFQKNKTEKLFTSVVYIAKNINLAEIPFPENLRYLKELTA